ncbi:3-phosphoserine/phosphohydroxythreonine transaminase [Williamwhitmania taraxaci]|uniref:Phosphoserine aminotransferase n=1 Tax=Williamwhitmania taraxaci TaxID=1640674 RepID=A0A1G6T0D9_9BACT|nr:3-phosphoserine/phosphohydroxythreonine transaminase [Williamwhitmania taraxaci]SDD22479.1 phosphoserine aminotransferase apoenzyme [Williamwhitmania taraxaci]
MKKHNFTAGPCILAPSVIENLSNAVKDFDGQGLSLVEVSHREKAYEAVHMEALSLFKELLNIPDGYKVVFLGGGASLQFCMIPFNLMNKKSAYLETGVWASKALKEAKLFGEVVTVASSADKNFSYYPKGYSIPKDADYFHITTNNTIYGTEIHEDMDCPVTLIADMSSDIFSRPVDVKKYGMIYGGAQKNLAPAGVTFVVVREDLLGKVDRKIPTMLDYRTHIKEDSMFNTPPVFAIYAMRETLRWVKSIGGVAKMFEMNKAKANLLYNEIDRNTMFQGTAAKEDRSLMNVCFVMTDKFKEKEADFMTFAKENGMVGIKGHRSVGGFRASLYNALPIESVQALVDCMKEFEKKNA